MKTILQSVLDKLETLFEGENNECSYEDENIAIVEIGGKHFENFVELFNGNAVNKKVVCIIYRDYKWIIDEKVAKIETYQTTETEHIQKLMSRFPIDNFHISTQYLVDVHLRMSCYLVILLIQIIYKDYLKFQ